MTTLPTHESAYVCRPVPRNASFNASVYDFGSAAASIFPSNDPPSIRVSQYMRSKQAAYYAVVRRGARTRQLRSNKESSNPLLRSLVASAGLLMPFEASEELTTTAADTVPHLAPLAQPRTVANIDETSDEEDCRSWRGVFAIQHPQKVLFRKRIDIRPGKLKEWAPDPISTRGRRSEDDE